MTSKTAPSPAASQKHRPRRWWGWPLIILAILAYALIFGEYFLRLMAPQALVPRYVTGGADGVRANIPDAVFRQWTPEVDVRLRYNGAGQRDDRPAPAIGQTDACRIALLGDSYFVGFESNFEDSFARQLEQVLASHGHDCRTINFAVSGFGHAEMLRILNSRVQAYQPDVLLVSVHQTDGQDNLRANLYRQTTQGVEDTGNIFLPGVGISDRLNEYRLYRWAQENSHLYAALREWAGVTGKKLLAMLRMRSQQEEVGPDQVADRATDDQLPGWVANQRGAVAKT